MGELMANVVHLKKPATADSMRELHRRDAEWMRAAARGLERLDVGDREEFARWIGVVSQRLGTCEDHALVFGVSPATYSRWMSGSNLPPIYAREPIVSRLRKLVLERAELLDPK
jgi:hypothetical protein